MIRKPSNWESVQSFSERKKLPLGAYVCRIKKANVQQNSYGERLCMAFDIEDGEYAGFYAADFKSNTSQDKKWRGVLRYFLPKDDGSDKDELTKSSLKGLITSIENSNPGFVWAWDEQALAGKLVGIIFRNEEWEYNGKTGWTVRPFRACSVDTVVDGTFTIPEDKPMKKASPAPVFASVDDDDAQLPF